MVARTGVFAMSYFIDKGIYVIVKAKWQPTAVKGKRGETNVKTASKSRTENPGKA